MNQPVHTGLQLNEGAEGAYAHDFAGQHRAHGIFLLNVVPGTRLQLLVAKGDAVALTIQGEDLDLDLFIGSEHFAWNNRAVPAQV